MKRAIAFGSLLVFLLGITGCGGGANPESLVKDRIKAMNDLAEAYKSKDDAKINAGEKKIEDVDSQLAKANKEELGKALKNHMEEWTNAGMNLGKEAVLSGKSPPKSLTQPSWMPGP